MGGDNLVERFFERLHGHIVPLGPRLQCEQCFSRRRCPGAVDEPVESSASVPHINRMRRSQREEAMPDEERIPLAGKNKSTMPVGASSPGQLLRVALNSFSLSGGDANCECPGRHLHLDLRTHARQYVRFPVSAAGSPSGTSGRGREHRS